MKKWKLEIKSIIDEENEAVEIILKLALDGVFTNSIMNMWGWKDVIFDKGEKEIYTCTCGDSLCGGYVSDISYTDRGIYLQNLYHANSRKKAYDLDLELSWEDIYAFYGEVLEYIDDLSKEKSLKNISLCGGEILSFTFDKYTEALEYLKKKLNK